MNDLHYIQIAILLELGQHTKLSFSDFNSDRELSIAKDKFNYHLQTLVKTGFIVKYDMQYELSIKGKQLVSRYDFSSRKKESVPKLSVMARIFDGTKLLISQRRKQPFINQWGVVTGKVRFGESFEQAMVREVQEETGLTPTQYKLKTIQRWIDHNDENTLVHDATFVTFDVSETCGDLQYETDESINEWCELAELHAKHDLLPSLDRYCKHNINPVKQYESISVEEYSTLVKGF